MLLAALGETFAEQAGLLNLGIEGMMLMGAFGGFYVALNSNSITAGLVSGLAIGAFNGVAVTKFKMNPLMTTLGTWWVAQGVAYGMTQGISPHKFSKAFVSIQAWRFMDC